MKEGKTEPSSCIKEFTNYVICRGKKVLKLKKADFGHASIDIHPASKTIWVWFHAPERVVGRAQFNFDGRCCYKIDNRLKEPTPTIKEDK